MNIRAYVNIYLLEEAKTTLGQIWGRTGEHEARKLSPLSAVCGLYASSTNEGLNLYAQVQFYSVDYFNK